MVLDIFIKFLKTDAFEKFDDALMKIFVERYLI